MQHPAIILVRPQMGENIGAAARAMWNFGLSHLRVVAPRDGWPNERAVALASGAGRVLDHALLTQSVTEGIADLHYCYATTARERDLTKTVFTPQAAMRDALSRIACGQRVGVLFGPERAGLENDDIVQANAIITVPINPDFPSLNLAQCVLLVAYEWRQRQIQAQDALPDVKETQLADRHDIDHLAQHYEQRLEEAGFFFPTTKAAGMKRNLRNLWSRLPLTDADVQVFHGIMRQMVRWKERS